MQYERWAPVYRRIQDEFRFSWAREEAARDVLRSLLPESARRSPLGRLRPRVDGRDAVVVGLAPGAGAPPLDRLGPTPVVLIAADGATEPLVRRGLTPEIIVTDLDGPVASEVAANARGAFVVVHAHGDNVPALERWVPEFVEPLAGSWAGPPDDELLDVGGFTDGDRGAFLAVHLGARRVLLWGFEFDRVDEADPVARERKRAKLRWAAEALGLLARDGPTPLLTWDPDGTRRPYVLGSTTQ